MREIGDNFNRKSRNGQTKDVGLYREFDIKGLEIRRRKEERSERRREREGEEKREKKEKRRKREVEEKNRLRNNE